ncbi:MAG: zinc ABC transporter substrate-binding protein, partial [Spirochaetes bacterium]|nr:zinc ABC transporter substrate-binding protein [Spirochaetota bacterium]
DAHSIKKIAELKKRAIQENIKVVIIDYYAQNNVATAFVREINGVAVRLDGIGDPNDPLRANYLSLMEFNAKKLSEALSQ